MVDKLEASCEAKAGDNADLGNGEKNAALNLVDLKSDNRTNIVEAATGTTQADTCMKAFPAFDVVDSGQLDSQKKAENRAAINGTELPKYAGVGNYATIDESILAVGKAETLKEQNFKAVNSKEPPKYEGVGNFATVGESILAVGKAETLKEQNFKAFDVKEKPKYEGASNW